MSDLTILFPAIGGEPTVAAVQALRAEWPGPERLRIIGCDTDYDKRVIVNTDLFLLSPRRDDPDYVNFLLELCAREHVDVFWPNPTEEQLLAMQYRQLFEAGGMRLLLPPDRSLAVLSDKRTTYQYAASLGIHVPQWQMVENWRQLCQAAQRLGYPTRPVVFRRTFGKGAIGLRILWDDPNAGEDLFNRAPDGRTLPLAALRCFIKNYSNWPSCMVCEYLPGNEFDVDCLCSENGLEVAVTRRNDAMWLGSSWRAVTLDRPDLTEVCRRLLEPLNWRYICSATFREDYDGRPALLEVNTRMPSSINLSWNAGCNLPLAALLVCLGRPMPRLSTPKPGVRIVRFLGESFLVP